MLDVHVDPATKLKDLRNGEQQLVESAKAISLNSEIIIMDEPTSAISEKEAEKLFAIIRKLRSEGKGIIYITHRMEEIFQIADRLTVMRDGTYIGTVKASETSKDEIIKMMVGRDMSEQYPKDPTEKGEIALKVENLTYTPPAGSFRRSLKNISLYVRHGEVLGIAGLAGAGRSELFECLAGVHYKDTTAKISIDGKEVTIKNPADAIKAGISFATEDRKGTGLVLQRSIGENMSLPLLKKFSPAFFMKSGEEKKEWNKQMETLRVKAPGTKTLASALSGGNQQKVVLGRWLMTEPKILLLDEPTRGIDVGAKAEIYQLINNLAKQWMAKQYHAQDIVDLVLALSGFFRISLSHGKEFITLEQEVLMVKNYLDIQKVRYEDLFEYKTEIEEGLGNYMVLKICLQPLVENALYHGIKESDQDRGTIWIRAFSESDDSIILKVEDDGAGMSQERMNQLNSWLKLKERGEEIKAYGMLNVNDRIKIAYGDEYGLHYEKRTGGGTVAVVRLRRLQKEVCGKF